MQDPKLKALYWDVDVDPEQLHRLLYGEIDRVGHIDRINLYRRLLMTYDWYTLLAIIPPERLREALSDPVLDRLFLKASGIVIFMPETFYSDNYYS